MKSDIARPDPIILLYFERKIEIIGGLILIGIGIRILIGHLT